MKNVWDYGMCYLLLAFFFLLVTGLALSSNLKMGAVRFSEHGWTSIIL
jgi:hypothetical protein